MSAQTSGVGYFTHLECGSGCGAGPFDPREKHFLCPSCNLPMLARYDLAAARAWKKESLAGRPANMWRYREMMPLLPGEEPVTLGEGFTPLIHAKRLGKSIGLDRLLVKDESLNPTNSFKARGLSAAVTRAARLRASVLSVPSAGNAATALAAYAAASLPRYREPRRSTPTRFFCRLPATPATPRRPTPLPRACAVKSSSRKMRSNRSSMSAVCMAPT